MAKPKEAPLFEEPEFDEKEYLIMEKERAKGIMLIALIGGLSGLLAGYLQLIGYWELSILLMFAILVLLSRILTIFGIKVSPRATHKLLNYGVYILTWLLFWIILLNPPMNVVSSPQLHTPTVQQSSGQWTALKVSGGVYEAFTGSHSYSILLTYKSGFNVTALDFLQQGSSGVPVSVAHTFSNGYLNFTFATTFDTQYDFTIQWTSPIIQNSNPLAFSLIGYSSSS